jgi:hypothetical protein
MPELGRTLHAWQIPASLWCSSPVVGNVATEQELADLPVARDLAEVAAEQALHRHQVTGDDGHEEDTKSSPAAAMTIDSRAASW